MSGALEAVVPVITEETLYYRRPLGLHDRFSVTLTLGGLSPDAARFLIVNRLEGPDGEICAEVLARGAWMHSLRRALVTPREPAARALETLRREHAFDPFC
jgi:acyl-CoA thioesterase FadM